LVSHRGGAEARGELRAEKVENRGVRGLGCVGDRYATKLGTSEQLEHYSFPITQEGRDNARIAATVEYG
jgi:hypothetical protein